MPHVDSPSAENEHRYHHYSSNTIPWYVRLIWLLFWVFVIYYTLRYFMPAIQTELVAPP